MKGKKFYISLAAIAVIAVVTFIMTSGGQEVRTVQVTKGMISRQVEDTAIVQPVSDEKLYANQNARVVALPVEIGQIVTKGQVLLRLENADLGIQLTEAHSRLAQANTSVTSAQARVNQLNHELAAARTDFKRIESLYKEVAVSQEEYEKAVLKLESAESALKQQKALLDSVQAEAKGLLSQVKQLETKSADLEIVSPIAGMVLELPVKNAQPVTAGNLLVAVGSSQNLELKASILSDDLANIRIGQPVIITAPVLANKQISGRVTRIYPRAEEQMSALGVVQRRVPVIIAINDKANLQPGYEVRVAIETNRLENVLVLPIESVRSLPDQQKQVMLIKDGRVLIQTVKTGLSDPNYIQITSGLEAGNTVIQDANLDLKAKTRVKALAK